MSVSQFSEDTILGGQITLRQPKKGYRVAIDPIFLAAAVNPACGSQVAELGCGSGAASLCLLARASKSKGGSALCVTGLEIQSEVAELARFNAALNGLEERLRIVQGDLREMPQELAKSAFDQVLLNPPYLRPGQHRSSPNDALATANSEQTTPLQVWLDAALVLLKPKGRLTLIHRAERLPEILQCLNGRAGAQRVFPLWPKDNEPARRVIVSARKGSGEPLQILPGMRLHQDGGAFAPEADAVLRGAKGILL